MEFNPRQTLLLAVLVYFLGKYLVNNIQLLKNYNIPIPVVGGIVASVLSSIIYIFFDIEIEYSLYQRDVLLVVFFTCVGLSSRFSALLKGGKMLFVLLTLSIIYLFVQNYTGVAVAMISGMDVNIGVLAGSVSLSGGHGTSIAWAPTFIQEYGINNASEIGIACATFGLVIGGVIGGPISNYLIKRYDLKSSSNESISIDVSNEKSEQITAESIFSFLLILSVAIGIGLHVHELLDVMGIKLPVFVPCLFGGILLTNTVPYIWKKMLWPTGTPTLAIVSEISLGLFLSMSLMSLQLWSLVDLALPILLLLTSQALMVTIFSIFVVFRALGKNYEAAVMSSGYAGLALGATPTAIANMAAITKKSGAAPQAFIIVPLVGSFFIDISNSIIIQSILHWLN
ncbi:MAG: sodium/glutamate symporter [Candidatus Endonucleobacter sp. (ex Gigantidas childressi)]|nr:sodium/glutamate symporter [Candidatus Endonucleobacter sp. (ex Gigantidas childressi)]